MFLFMAILLVFYEKPKKLEQGLRSLSPSMPQMLHSATCDTRVNIVIDFTAQLTEGVAVKVRHQRTLWRPLRLH